MDQQEDQAGQTQKQKKNKQKKKQKGDAEAEAEEEKEKDEDDEEEEETEEEGDNKKDDDDEEEEEENDDDEEDEEAIKFYSSHLKCLKLLEVIRQMPIESMSLPPKYPKKPRPAEKSGELLQRIHSYIAANKKSLQLKHLVAMCNNMAMRGEKIHKMREEENKLHQAIVNFLEQKIRSQTVSSSSSRSGSSSASSTNSGRCGISSRVGDTSGGGGGGGDKRGASEDNVMDDVVKQHERFMKIAKDVVHDNIPSSRNVPFETVWEHLADEDRALITKKTIELMQSSFSPRT